MRLSTSRGTWRSIGFLRALYAFSKVRDFADFRRVLPADAYYVAKIAAYRQEDCGSCLQIAVNQAREHQVQRGVIQAAGDRRVDALSPELRLVFRFAEAQANRDDDPGGFGNRSSGDMAIRGLMRSD